MLTVDDAVSIATLKEHVEMLVNNNVIKIIGQDFLIPKPQLRLAVKLLSSKTHS
jgi:tetraacyldisaccharide-1-P 4'-kinase